MLETLQKPNSKLWLSFLVTAILLGALLRLSYPGDIEYKGDEKYMFDATLAFQATGSLPLIGMTTGVGGKNPGLSVWVFLALAKLTHSSTPPELARAVQLLNILGLGVLAFFSLRLVREAERLPWLWATALAAVNPFAVVFGRKIWAQCTLSLFCVLFWMAWYYRQRRMGAFFWGLIGVCLGQVHLSGFFLAAAVFLWTLYRDRQARWGWWVFGSGLGALFLIPWAQYMLTHPGYGFSQMEFQWLVRPKFWNYWVTDPLGLGLTYFLKTVTFMRFWAYPGGTYLVAVLHVIIVLAAIWILVLVQKNGGFSLGLKDRTQTGFALQSVGYLMGILLTLSCAQVFRHYLVITFPLEWVWLARLGLRDPKWGPRTLMVLWVAQLLLTALFLGFIHLNHGDVLGDYGVGYQFQIR